MAPTPRLVLLAQGAYYLVTGFWPLFSMASFEAVTGPKTDDWLVRMVALLAVSIGATIVMGAAQRPPHLLLLSVLTALSFTTIDFVYVVAGVISWIYLADAVVEIAILTALGASLRLASRDHGL